MYDPWQVLVARHYVVSSNDELRWALAAMEVAVDSLMVVGEELELGTAVVEEAKASGVASERQPLEENRRCSCSHWCMC